MKINLSFTISTFASILSPLDSVARGDSNTRPLTSYTPVMKVPVIWKTMRSTKVPSFQEILLAPLTIMMVEATRSSVTSIHFYQTTRSHVLKFFNTEHIKQFCSLNYIPDANSRFFFSWPRLTAISHVRSNT